MRINLIKKITLLIYQKNLGFGLTLLFLGYFSLILFFKNFSLGYFIKNEIFHAQTMTKSGVVTDVYSIRSYNDIDVLAFEYYFDVSGKKYIGKDVTTNSNMEIDNSVIINYIKDNPSYNISKYENIKDFDSSFIIIGLIFTIIGFFLIFKGIIKGFITLKILQFGISGKAICYAKTQTLIRINDRRIYKVKFKYNFKGKEYKTIIKTVNWFKYESDSEKEYAIIFLEKDPSKVCVVKNLPIKI